MQKEACERLIPALIFRPPTCDEEFTYLLSLLKNLPFYQEHGYKLVLPDHSQLQCLTQNILNHSCTNNDTHRSFFETNIFDGEFYNAGLLVLESNRTNIESIFPRFDNFRKKWGVNFLNSYELVLTRYGPGGKYDPDTGLIVALTRKDGSFMRKPSFVVGHEIVEITIHPFITRFRLTHEEKERVTDCVCTEVITDYIFQTDDPNIAPVGDKRVDNFITRLGLENLPAALENYVREFPRE